MTVKELIELLQECNPDKQVEMFDYNYEDMFIVIGVEENENGVELKLS